MNNDEINNLNFNNTMDTINDIPENSTTHRERSSGSIKTSDLVIAALQHLNEPKGSSPKEIVNYLQREYNCPSKAISRCVYTALKRGVDYGVLKRAPGNNYTLAQTNDEGMVEAACRRKRKKCVRRKRRKSCRRRRRRRRSCSRRKRRCARRRRRRRSVCKRRRKRSSRRRRSACRRRKTACRRKRRRSACKRRRKSCRRRCSIEEFK